MAQAGNTLVPPGEEERAICLCPGSEANLQGHLGHVT